YKKVASNDFETQNATIVYLSEKRWQKLGQAVATSRHSNIMHCAEAGTVIVLPMPHDIRLNGITLTSMMLILHWLNELRMHSTYFKFHHMQSNFGKTLSKALSEEVADHARIAGQPIHWRIIHRYYGHPNVAEHPEIFQPHIQPEDISFRKAE